MGTVTVHYRRSADNTFMRVDEVAKAQVVEVLPQFKVSPIVGHLQRHHKLYTTALMASAGLMLPLVASASAVEPGMGGGKSIILLLQQASFWVGMGITIWGIVEAQLDFPGWRGRITKGILGYIGILLVPLIFIELQNSLQVDVWSKIDKGMK